MLLSQNSHNWRHLTDADGGAKLGSNVGTKRIQPITFNSCYQSLDLLKI